MIVPLVTSRAAPKLRAVQSLWWHTGPWGFPAPARCDACSPSESIHMTALQEGLLRQCFQDVSNQLTADITAVAIQVWGISAFLQERSDLISVLQSTGSPKEIQACHVSHCFLKPKKNYYFFFSLQLLRFIHCSGWNTTHTPCCWAQPSCPVQGFKWERAPRKAWNTDPRLHSLREWLGFVFLLQTLLVGALGSPSCLMHYTLSINRCHMLTALIELIRFNGMAVGK